MRSGERFVQIELNNIRPHMTRLGHTHQGVEISSVHIHQRPVVVQHVCDLENFTFKESERVRVGHHKGSHFGVRILGNFVGTEHAVRTGCDLHHVIAA